MKNLYVEAIEWFFSYGSLYLTHESTWKAMRKNSFYNLLIITLAMQDFRLQCK